MKYPRTASMVLLAFNVALFFVQLKLTAMLVASQHGDRILPPVGAPMSAADVLNLPYPLAFITGNASAGLHRLYIVLALVQTAALFGLWKILIKGLQDQLVRIAVGVSAVLLFAFALQSKWLASTDVYAYIGYAKLGFAHAYSPTAQPFSGDFAVINRLWGLPQLPCLYGPLWLAVEHLAAGWTTSIAQAMISTRIVSILSLLGCAVALWRLKAPAVIYPLLLLNPAIIKMYVVDGHNDLLGVLFVILALAAAAGAPLVAAVLIACAGLVKVSLIGLSVVVFRGPGSLWLRCGYVATSLAILVAGSFAFGGTAYVNDMFHQVGWINSAFSHDHLSFLLIRILEVVAVLVLVAAFFRGTLVPAGSWPLFTISGVAYPWYLIWGLPYAAVTGSGLITFLIALPAVSAMVEAVYGDPHYSTLALAAIVIYVLVSFVRLFLGSRSARPLVSPVRQAG
jgi:hypothetical protein